MLSLTRVSSTLCCAIVAAGCGSDAPAPAPTSDAATEVDSAVDAATSDASADSTATPDAPADADAGSALAFPIIDPPAGFAALPSEPPMTLTGATGKTISGVSISNPDGPCIVIRGGADIVIDRVAIGPCRGDGIRIDGRAARVTIRGSYIHDTGGNGVSTYQASDVTVTGSWFARTSSGGYFLESSGVRFERSSVLNVQGPMPRGQLAQFDKVTGANNAVRCNVMENRAGESTPEDGINLYQSSGTATSPIVVEGNRIRGGGPSESGGGILLGDGGGSSAHQIARFNVLVDPGQYGVAVAGGRSMLIEGNVLFAKRQPFTNVGIYVWDQYTSSCSDVTVKGNRVDWTNKAGAKNPWWNGDNCAALTESGNEWSASLDETILAAVPEPCR